MAAGGFVRSRVGGLPRSFWVLWAGTLVNRLGTMVVPFLALYLTGPRGLSLAATGVVLALGFAYELPLLVAAWLARLRRDRVLIGSLLLMAAGWGATAFADSVPLFVAAVVVWTFGEIANASAAPATVADLAPPHLRCRYSGAFGMTYGLSAALSPLIGTRLLEIGPGVLWGTSAAVCLAAALLVHRLAPEILRRIDAAQEGGSGEPTRASG